MKQSKDKLVKNETEKTEKKKWVQERFSLEKKGGFGDEVQIVDDSVFEDVPEKPKLAPRLNKYWPTKDGWKTSSYKIKNYERWLQIKEMLEKKVFQKIGWIKISELDEEIKKDIKLKSDVKEKIQKVMEQNPSFINNFLDKLDVANLGKEDVFFITELINNLDKKLLEADKSMKETFKSLIKNLSKSKKKGLSELDDLLNEWNLLEVTSLSSILCRKLGTLELLEEMITKKETYELRGDNSIHRILERNMWILDENYWLIQSNKSLRTFIGDAILKKRKNKAKKRPDFVCCTWENKLIIVEIKKPSLTVGKEEIDQIEDYTIIAEDYKGKEFKNTEAILVGNKISSEGRKLIKKRSGIKFVTYNDLIEKVKERYKEYLKKLEEIKIQENSHL